MLQWRLTLFHHKAVFGLTKSIFDSMPMYNTQNCLTTYKPHKFQNHPFSLEKIPVGSEFMRHLFTFAYCAISFLKLRKWKFKHIASACRMSVCTEKFCNLRISSAWKPKEIIFKEDGTLPPIAWSVHVQQVLRQHFMYVSVINSYFPKNIIFMLQ